MIDIHTHILPRFDDGAKDMHTAVAMLQAQAEQGVTTVVLTPHYYGKRFSPAQFLEQRKEAFARLREHLPEGMDIRLGTEVHFAGVNMPAFEELCKLAIEGTKYILIELPFTTVWTGGLIGQLADFINETGYIPIIAHVERYEEILRTPSLATELVQMGCLLQVNARSFWEKPTRGFTCALLKHGLVHCVGSDCHDMENRGVNLSEAKKFFSEKGFFNEWKRSQKITESVIAGEQVCVEAGKPLKKIFGKYF